MRARNPLCREAPGPGEDVVVSGEELEHPVHVPGQRVFAADLAHPWEVVDLLQRCVHRCMRSSLVISRHSIIHQIHSILIIRRT